MTNRLKAYFDEPPADPVQVLIDRANAAMQTGDLGAACESLVAAAKLVIERIEANSQKT